MNCPDCRRTLAVGATHCECGWNGFPDKKVVVRRPCHFESDGKCRFDHDRFNRHEPPKGATVRINDYWICNWHYEHGYDRVLRSGQDMSLSELKINNRLFGESKPLEEPV